jgi:stage III sporulation protein SpoIIIAA
MSLHQDGIIQLLEVLPAVVRERLEQKGEIDSLIEVVLDYGRPAEARYRERVERMHDVIVSEHDLEYVSKSIGEFGTDNRAGIERTLHRISAIRNRRGKIIGLTCRVGRAVEGTIDIIDDIVRSEKSILLLGRPGVGKTTKLREVARVLADEVNKRVVIVDTSNEIAGDGDVPHPGIGSSRRMQVRQASEQHSVMIEAVENHMPEVIVIDEIGTEAEAGAA